MEEPGLNPGQLFSDGLCMHVFSMTVLLVYLRLCLFHMFGL